LAVAAVLNFQTQGQTQVYRAAQAVVVALLMREILLAQAAQEHPVKDTQAAMEHQ